MPEHHARDIGREVLAGLREIKQRGHRRLMSVTVRRTILQRRRTPTRHREADNDR